MTCEWKICSLNSDLTSKSVLLFLIPDHLFIISCYLLTPQAGRGFHYFNKPCIAMLEEHTIMRQVHPGLLVFNIMSTHFHVHSLLNLVANLINILRKQIILVENKA
jgi:hypothetical protein